MTRGGGIGGHQSPSAQKDEWLTPQYILNAIGPFDLDPCAPIVRPWDTAAKHFTIEDNGLAQRWEGRVWCNPPYGAQTDRWLALCASHGNAIALIFARTETRMFFDRVWSRADALLFLEGRLFFHHASGRVAECNSGAPSVLVAYGGENARCLRNCRLKGYWINLRGGNVE